MVLPYLYEQNGLMYIFNSLYVRTYQICCYIAIYMLFHLLDKLSLNGYNASSEVEILLIILW